jgi:23S rRNA (uracil1939-C5)-methyltransferase
MPLFELCEIEWGQRKKPLILDSSGEFKLLKKYSTLPSLFQTSVLNEPFNLKMHVSDFSQPNTQLNFQIIEHITQILKQKPKPILAEFGSGIGNFTFAMAHYCQHIVCFEWDQFACEAWNENIEEFQKKYSHIPCQIQLVHRDARAQFSIESFSPKFLFVNPSRSGLGDFLKSISMKDVEFILYLSCYHETLIKDMLPLKDQFVCEKIICIDQFPYSRHIETLSFWIRR